MSPKGGKRKGAGKPALYNEPMERYNVTLDKQTVMALKKLGNGNLSDGIRKAGQAIISPKVTDGSQFESLDKYNEGDYTASI